GGTANFSAPASGSRLSYQWFLDGVTLAGATASMLQVTNVGISDVGLYRVRVTSGSKSINSIPAGLQISMLDGSPNPNGIAYDKFQAAWTALTALLKFSCPNTYSKGSDQAKSAAGGTS